MKKIIFFILSCFSFSPYAQKDTVKLPEVEIKEEVNKISSLREITLSQLSFQTTIIPVLQGLTSIYIREYSNKSLSTISFRGTSSSHTQVIFDDFSINPLMIGQPNANNLSPLFFEKVEIYTGLQSLFHHYGGLGGLIKLYNDVDFSMPYSLAIFAEAGSFGAYSLNTKLQLKKGNTVFRTKVLFEEANNNYEYVNNTSIPYFKEKRINAAYSHKGILHEVYTLRNKNLLNLKIFYKNDFNYLPAPITQKQIQGNEFYTNEDFKIIAGYNNSKNTQTIKLKTSFENWSYQNKILKIESLNQTTSNSIFFQQKVNLKRNSNLIFNSLSNYKVLKTNNYLQTVNHFDSYLSISYLKSFKYNLSIKGIGYVIYYQLFNVNNAYSFEILKKLNEKNNFAILFGSNKRFPSFNDLYWHPGGNINLKPEKSKSIEFQINNKLKINELKLFIYKNTINDWIIWLPTENINIWSPQNIKKVIASGIDIINSFNYDLNLIKLVNQTSISYSKTLDYTDKNSDYYKKQLIYTPQVLVSNKIRIEYKSINFTVNTYYVDKRFIDNENNVFLPSYFITSISISKKIENQKVKTQITFDVNNVFNENYQVIVWQPMPRRNYKISLIVSI